MLFRVAGGNAHASGVEAVKQLYASGLAGAAPPAANGASSHRQAFLDEEPDDEFQPKKAANPEVRPSLSAIHNRDW